MEHDESFPVHPSLFVAIVGGEFFMGINYERNLYLKNVFTSFNHRSANHQLATNQPRGFI